jgi:hypothetical protein
LKRFAKKRRGQLRLIEVLLAVSALFTAFTSAIFLTSASHMNALQVHSDLDRVGSNILIRLAESGVIDSTVSGSTVKESTLQNTVTSALPPLTYYSLEINLFDSSSSDKIPTYQKIGTVTNTTPDSFRSTAEVSSTSFMYTASSGDIYYLVLKLTKAG